MRKIYPSLLVGLFLFGITVSSLYAAPKEIEEKTAQEKSGLIHSESETEQYLLRVIKRVSMNSDSEQADSELYAADSFIKYLYDHRKALGDENTAKLCLLLRQDKYANVEDLTSLYGSILWENTPAAVNAMVEAKNALMPEFKNAEFYEDLYSLGISVPYDNTGLPEAERVKKAKPLKDRLKGLRNTSNAEFIDFLVSGEKLEQWTY